MKIRITASQTIRYSQVIEIDEEDYDPKEATNVTAETWLDLRDVEDADPFDCDDCEVEKLTPLDELKMLPKINFDVAGKDGNAMALIGGFSRAANRTVGWDRHDIESFQKIATSGDYDNVLQTILTLTS